MRILIIEDDKEIAEFLKNGLKSASFAVDVAYDGETGSFMGRTNEYDLIISDNMLPLKEGSLVCHEIRKAGKQIPILILSVRGESAEKVHLLNTGADDYLTKPFSFDELLARVRALLRRPRIVENEILSIDDLLLDARCQSVSRANAPIYLTRKEFSLLELLMRERGAVVSRSRILEHVWDTEIDPFSNTIETHILNLRKKIEVNNGQKLLHNIPGRGYKIDLEQR